MISFSDPKLQHLLDRIDAELGGIKDYELVPVDQYFWNLCQSVIGQQLSEKVAPKITERVEAVLKHQCTPEQVLATPVEVLRSAGLSNAKASYLHNIAQAWQTGLIKPETLADLDNEAVIANLVQIKGIGRWTAEMFLMFTLGRPDVFSAGDYGLRRALQLHFGLAPKAPPAELLKLAEQWKPHRTHAARVLWNSLELKDPV